MNRKGVQKLLAVAGAYRGEIDGAIGPKSWAAIREMEQYHGAAYTFNPREAEDQRRIIAAGQAALALMKFEPGAIDGFMGKNTREAFKDFRHMQAWGTNRLVPREALPLRPAPASIPTQAQVEQVYGRPGPALEKGLVMITLPFRLRIDYNLRQTTNRMRVHPLAAEQLKRALIETHDHYGEERWRALGLDRYAGTYEHRRMRGGSAWSMHAYGIAIDFFTKPNGLKTRCPKALFCGADYQPFLDIMERNEWLPAIRLWGADAMHFQRARL